MDTLAAPLLAATLALSSYLLLSLAWWSLCTLNRAMHTPKSPSLTPVGPHALAAPKAFLFSVVLNKLLSAHLSVETKLFGFPPWGVPLGSTLLPLPYLTFWPDQADSQVGGAESSG